MQQKIVSREYKVVLKKELFTGLQTDLLERAGEFWKAFKSSVQDIVSDTNSNFNEIEKRRCIRFYDSKKQHFQKSSYVFRERVNLETGKRKATLKFRHPDRYVSQDRDMAAANVKNGKTKFEEDIKLPFTKLYSFSTKQPIADSTSLNKLKDLGRLFPGLKKRLKSYQKNKSIEIVGDFTAIEFVILGPSFQISMNPRVKVQCALVVWYDQACGVEQPVVVEFSFKYENEDEKYDGEAALKAYDVLSRFNGLLAEWVDFDGPTKTAYVYSKARLK